MAQQASTYYTYNTPVGRVTLASNGNALTHLAFGAHPFEGAERPSELTNEASNQLQEYFAGKRSAFNIPLDPEGTAFQRQVWDAVGGIPYGQTQRFERIARAIGDPQATRALGTAANKNPIPIIIPTHRVVCANGKPSGSRSEVRIKQFLLDLEARGL